MHVTACLAGQWVDVEVGEDCRTVQALKESVVKALPQLRVEGFDVSVGGRALDDEGIVSLEESACLDVSANARGVSVLALHEAGREVSEVGLLEAADKGDVTPCTLYLAAGVPLDCVNDAGLTPLHLSCRGGHVEIARLLLDRGSNAIDEKSRGRGHTPLHLACYFGHVEIASLLLDRGSRAIDAKNRNRDTPLHHSCRQGHLSLAALLLNRGSAVDEKNIYGYTPLSDSCRAGRLSLSALLLDRGSRAIDEKNDAGQTPLDIASCSRDLPLVSLLLDRGCDVNVKKYKERIKTREAYPQEVLDLFLARGHVLPARSMVTRIRSKIWR